MRIADNELQAAIADSKDWALQGLSELVAQDTTLGSEEGGQRVMAALFESLGYKPVWEQISAGDIEKLAGFSPVDWPLAGKKNVVAFAQKDGPGKSLICNGHIDVVSPEPVELWTSPPFQPRLAKEDGTSWMYGRGAGDMKGGSIAYLWALHALQALGFVPHAKCILQSVVEEECTGNGTLSLLAKGYRADAGLIPEPFHESITVSQVGVLWFDVRVLGRTTHVLGAGRGVNAIEKSWVVIQALRKLEEELNEPGNISPEFATTDHPLNLNVGIIRGGDWASTVAGECTTRFRIGLLPGQKMSEIQKRVEAAVRSAAASDPWLQEFPPEVQYIGFQAEGCTFSPDTDLGKTLRAAHRRWHEAEPDYLASTATTDIRFFNLYYDIPATCYGPAAENIHGVDERVNLDSIERVALVYASFIEEWCGLKKRE